MEKTLITLLVNTVTMSIIIISLLLLTPLLSKKYAAAWWYYTWLIVVVGLLIPLRPKFETALVQIQRAAPPQPSPVNQVITDYTGTVEMTDTFVSLPHSVDQTMSISWPQWAGLVWIAGMTAFFLFHLFRHYQFMKLVKRWGRDASDPCLLSILQQMQIDRGISKPIKLKICPLVTSPMMIGFINPVIILPQHSFSPDELKFILTHELIHFKRKDVWYNAAILISRGVHWFNPVVHLMARAISVHCEASCDEAVIKNANLEDRRRYGETIISVVRNQSKMKTALSTTFYGGKKGMKNRLFSIMDQNKKRKSVAVLCLVLTGTLVSGAVFTYGYDGNSNPSRNTNHVAGTLNDVVVSNDKELEKEFVRFMGDHWQDMTVEQYEAKLKQFQTEQWETLKKEGESKGIAISYSSQHDNSSISLASGFNVLKKDSQNKTHDIDVTLNYGYTIQDKSKMTIKERDLLLAQYVSDIKKIVNTKSFEQLNHKDIVEQLQKEINTYTDGQAGTKLSASYEVSQYSVDGQIMYQKDVVEQHQSQSATAHSSVAAYEGSDGSGQPDESLKSYLNYGITYEPKTDRYLFENKIIRLLIDENRKVSGETNALYFDASGEIDVKVIRDADNRIEKIAEVNEKALQDLSDQYSFRISEGNITFQ